MAKSYVDGFLLVVPTRKLSAYRKMSQQVGEVYREFGALEYRECAGDDMKAQLGIPFPKRAGAKKGETVVFSWIVYRSRAQRDRIQKRVMADPRLAAMCQAPMPFDVQRMSMGGFEVIVDA